MYINLNDHNYNLDILNCMINDHNCSQLCVEVEGSFNCSCYLGFELHKDKVTCTGNQMQIHLYMHISTVVTVHTYTYIHTYRVYVRTYACTFIYVCICTYIYIIMYGIVLDQQGVYEMQHFCTFRNPPYNRL